MGSSCHAQRQHSCDRQCLHKIGAAASTNLYAFIDLIQVLLHAALAMQLLYHLILLLKLWVRRMPSIQHRHVHLIHRLKVGTCNGASLCIGPLVVVYTTSHR